MTDPVDPNRLPHSLTGPTDAERDAIMERLQQAFADGAMTVEQLDERLELAQSASNRAELDVLVRDLPGAPSLARGAALPVVQDGVTTLPTVADGPATDLVLSMFAGATRAGPWTPARRIRVVAAFGGTRLDFRAATFQQGTTEVRVLCLFGGVEIRVPRGVRVECHGTGLLGAFKDLLQEAPPGAPTLVVRGLALFGAVNVKSEKRDRLARRP